MGSKTKEFWDMHEKEEKKMNTVKYTMHRANFTRPYKRGGTWADDVFNTQAICKICGKPIGNTSIVCKNSSTRNPISGVSHVSCAKRYVEKMKKKDPAQYGDIERFIVKCEGMTIERYFTYEEPFSFSMLLGR